MNIRTQGYSQKPAWIWRHVLRTRFTLLMVLLAITSCSFAEHGTGIEEALECQPGEWQYKGHCVPAGLPPDMPCPPGELFLDDGRCQPAGLPLDMQCPPGELAHDNGKCQPAGVPPEMCGEGFEPDGKMGCNAILPAAACPFGLMAVPGETECHEVAPCAEGTWGDIPVDAATQFVNGAYAGNDSNGTKERPWKTIAKGILEAEAGAIVAVAEGTYEENLLITKQIKLWGVCPKKVTVSGAGSKASVTIQSNKSEGTQIHNLAITGAATGIDVSGAHDVVIDRVWIHDTGGRGVDVADTSGATSSTLRGSLIERARQLGAFAVGSEMAIEKCAIRSTIESGSFARGIQAQDNPATYRRAHIIIQGSIVEQVPQLGVAVFGSDAQIEASVVRDTIGPGIAIIMYDQTAERASVKIDRAVVENATGVGILILGSDAAITTTLVKGTSQDEFGEATGIRIEHFGVRSMASVENSTIDENEEVGVKVFDSDATINGSIIRNTHSISKPTIETGVVIASIGKDPNDNPSKATVHGSIIESNGAVGISILAAELTLQSSRVHGQGSFGMTVADNTKYGVDLHASASVRSCIIDKNHGVGVQALNSDLNLETSVVRGTLPYEQEAEDLLAVDTYVGTTIKGTSTNDVIQGSAIEPNNGMGIENNASDMKLAAKIIHDLDLDKLAWGNGTGIATTNSITIIRSSLLDSNRHSGLHIVDGKVKVDSTIIRNTEPNLQGRWGRGIYLTSNAPSERPIVAVRSSIIEENQDIGFFIEGANVSIEDTIVRATKTNGQGRAGRGINIQGMKNGKTSDITIRGSRFEDNHDMGLFIEGANVTIETTIVRGTRPNKYRLGGRGINIQRTEGGGFSKVEIRGSVSEVNSEMGLFVSSAEVDVERSRIRLTKSNADGQLGDGITVASELGPANVTLINVRVEHSDRASIANFGGTVEVHSSTLLCGAFDMSTQPYNEYAGAFYDKGDNHCGCPDATGACNVTDFFLMPPQYLPNLEPRLPSP